MGFLGKCSVALVVLVAAVAVAIQLILQQPQYAKAVVEQLIRAGGMPPAIWDTMEVLDESVWSDIVLKGNLGIAEAYMHKKVLIKDTKRFFITLLNGTTIGTRRREHIAEGGIDWLGWVMQLAQGPTAIMARISNQQTRDLSTRVTKQHYDAGNDLYERMLGPSMSYTCAFWKNATTLDQAQINKFDLVRRKLELSPGMKVADLGMGWGTAAAYVHEHGKVQVNGISLSEQQVKWAKANLQKPGLDFIWQDYRDHCENPAHAGTYDRVYSIGMLEHVGYRNYESFFNCVKKLLKPEGLAVVHSIGEPDFVPISDNFLEKYIFPGAVIPALSTLAPAFQDAFILEDLHNFGFDYSRTLAAWAVNSEAFFRENPTAYSPEFQRMWDYYLKMCEALFEVRINQLWQLVLSPRPATRQHIQRQT